MNCHFPIDIGILGQVWYLLVSIPDICTLSYFHVFPRDNIRTTFTVMHNPVFEESNTLSFDLLACIICSLVLFDLILYVTSTIFQLYRDGSSWVEPVLSYD